MNTCCYKALKHGETICPVCQQVLLPFNPTIQLKIQFEEKKDYAYAYYEKER